MTAPRPWAAVVGAPVAHSLSPVLHLAAYAELGLDWDYTAIECPEPRLGAQLAAVRPDERWRGFSVTMPLKLVALGLVDRLTPRAAAVGAVNTVVREGADLIGDNTDLPGVVATLRELVVDAPRRPVLLGAGGTARAALGALAELGATTVAVVVRSAGRAGPLVALAARLGVTVEAVEWSRAGAAVAGADVVVSTTPAGATDGLAVTGWPAGVPLLEVLYDPWPTELAAAAQRAGAPVAGGLALLVHQAAGQVELMSGNPAPIQAMRVAGQRALAARTGAHGG